MNRIFHTCLFKITFVRTPTFLVLIYINQGYNLIPFHLIVIMVILSPLRHKTASQIAFLFARCHNGAILPIITKLHFYEFTEHTL
jgi:hypothetical protein